MRDRTSLKCVSEGEKMLFVGDITDGLIAFQLQRNDASGNFHHLVQIRGMSLLIDLQDDLLPLIQGLFVSIVVRMNVNIRHCPFQFIVGRSDLVFIGSGVAEQTVGRWSLDDFFVHAQGTSHSTNFGLQQISNGTHVHPSVT